MTLLPSILHAEPQRYPLLILQSSLAQSSLPILRSLLVKVDSNSLSRSPRRNLLFCLLYPPSIFVDPGPSSDSDSVLVHDWLDRVPGYQDADTNVELVSIAEKVLQESSQFTTVIIDSVDTLLSDTGSVTETYKSLSHLYALVKQHGNARLILHSQSPSPLIPLITTTTFSSSLVHLIAHPPSLLHHLSTDLFVPPPPLSPDPKFWSVFIPISERTHDTERLVFGPSGEGSGHPSEIVIELIVRESTRRKRGVERILEGWSGMKSCELSVLESLKDLMNKQKEPVAAPDPRQNLPFNLNLTSSQQESRAQVPLPYVHTGQASNSNTPGAIYYDPDSADDIDDDDPDEDLEI